MSVDRVFIDFFLDVMKRGRKQVRSLHRAFRPEKSLEQKVAEPPAFTLERDEDSLGYAKKQFFSAKSYRGLAVQIAYAPLEIYNQFKNAAIGATGFVKRLMPDTEKYYWFDSVTNKPVFFKVPKKIYDILKERGFILDYLKE